MSLEREEDKSFKKCLKEAEKIDSDFIYEYLGTGATVECFIYRELKKSYSEYNIRSFLGDENYERLVNIDKAYNKGIEGQDVSDCDFTALKDFPEYFEMLRFDEDTKFNQTTIEMFHPEEILKRGNTQIQSQTANGDIENQTDNGDMLHIAIIDTPIVENDTDNLKVCNFENSGEPQTDTHHGRSAYSIFSSINPNCVVHFYGAGSEDIDRAEAVKAIIEYNNDCTDESKKIRLVSCSHKIKPDSKEQDAITEGKLNVISANNIHNGHFFECLRFGDEKNEKVVVPILTEEEALAIRNRYKLLPHDGERAENKIDEKFESALDFFIDAFSAQSFKNAVLMNVNLVIDQPSSNKKRHECDFSVSWGVPVIAAYYAMALKADPNISYEEFYGICQECSSEKNHIFDENLFLEKIQAIEQQKISDSQSKKGKEDYKGALKESTDTSYRRGSIDECTGEVRADLIRRKGKEQNNDDPNIE